MKKSSNILSVTLKVFLLIFVLIVIILILREESIDPREEEKRKFENSNYQPTPQEIDSVVKARK